LPDVEEDELTMAYSVLIVDDSPVMRKYIRRVIALSGLDLGECFDAGNGIEALDVLRQSWVDIVLTDINMPEMNGEQLMEKISVDPLFASIPVVVISTDRSEGRMERMVTLGAKDYMTKPLLPETLGAAMLKVLARGAYASN
jgi:two-component system, chemotaxis family, chemotaxis protein CheY